ncbi:MAG: hypothetical protein ACYTDT_01045 [Planctomycetota bacterium]
MSFSPSSVCSLVTLKFAPLVLTDSDPPTFWIVSANPKIGCSTHNGKITALDHQYPHAVVEDNAFDRQSSWRCVGALCAAGRAEFRHKPASGRVAYFQIFRGNPFHVGGGYGSNSVRVAECSTPV